MADIPRIKRNIQKMIDQNAPEADIDAYVSSEGVTLEQLQAPAAPVEQPQQDRPWYKEAAQAADDIVRLTANGLTFGYADKLAGYMNGTGAEAERQRSQEASDRAGLAGNVAEIAGGIAGGGALLKGAGAVAKGVGAISPTVASVSNAAANLAARPGIVGFGARTAGAMGSGAALGALDAAGHDRDLAEGAAMGAAFGAAGNAVSEGVSKVAGKAAGAFNKKPQIMTREQLEEAANAAYKSADDAGLIISKKGLDRLTADIQDEWTKLSFHDKGHPAAKLFWDDMVEKAGRGDMTLQGLEQQRRLAKSLFDPTKPHQNKLLEKAVKRIDGLVETLRADEITAGNKTQGLKALQEARKFWGSAKKSEMIEEAVQKAQLSASAKGSGGNIDNDLRQQFKAILTNKKKRHGFTNDEIAAMQLIVKGTKGQNLMRLVGKMSPQGNGLMQLLQALGALGTGGASIPLAIAGTGAKVIADKATPANVERLSQIVRSGGKASALDVAPNAVQRLLEKNKGALGLPLTVGGILATN